jgi:glucosamine--fructose-6-phosphate aminotransferase (isomerizing)
MRETPGIIEGAYLRDILAQPQALTNTLEGLRYLPDGLASVAHRLARGEIGNVVLTGMGSSFHAFHPLHLRLIERGIHSSMVETSELFHYQGGLLGSRSLLVVASQSGRSAETLRLLEEKRGGGIVAVTNTADSPLAQAADVTLLTRAGEEATVSCKTYLAAQMALTWLASVFEGADPATACVPLESAAPAVAEYLGPWRDLVAELCRDLDGVRNVFLVGRGASLAAVGAGGLIVKESTHVHAEGMSSAAFRHGPMEMCSESVFVLVFGGHERTRDLNRRLFADVRAAGCRSALAGHDAEWAALRLPQVATVLLSIVELLPVEMLALALAALAGREAGRFTIAGKVTSTE